MTHTLRHAGRSVHAASGTGSTLREVRGLRLLPLQGGTLHPLACDAIIALPHEQRLVPALQPHMVHRECLARLPRYLLNLDFARSVVHASALGECARACMHACGCAACVCAHARVCVRVCVCV